MPMTKDTSEFKCPISHLIMLDPVIDKAGETYEREEIKAWFEQCKKESKPFTTPYTNETLEDDGLVPARKTKSQITQLLEEDPELWADVYLSKSAQERFSDAFNKKDKKALAVLINEEPRFLSFNSMEVLQWAMAEQDLTFLKEVVLPNLAKRGQKDKFLDVTLMAAEAKWKEGLRLLIVEQAWSPSDYFTSIKTWIHTQKIAGIKALLHEMQQQKIPLGTPDEQGNTLLHEAAKTSQADLITLLLLAGMDGTSKNADGATAEEIAAQQNQTAALQAFKQFHAAHASTGTPSGLQIKALQAEVQELKYQLAETKTELKAQTKHEMGQLFKGLHYAALPFFALVKESAKQNNYFLITPKIFSGHTDQVFSVAVLPDGRVLSGSADYTLKVWDAKTGQCLQTLSGHADQVYAVAVLPDGRVLSGSMDKTLKVWDANIGQCLQTLSGHTGPVYAVAMLPDGRVLSGSADYTLKVWDAKTGQCLQTLCNLNNSINFSRDSGTVNLSSYTVFGHTGEVRAVAVLPDGRVLSGSQDKTLKVWDIDTGKCLQTLSGHTGEVRAVAVLPDGRVISGSADKTLKVWEQNLALQQIKQAEKSITEEVPECKMM